MQKHIIEYYNKRQIEPFKLIQKGKRQGLSERRIKAAMKHCYYKIIDEQKKIPDIELARYVFNTARDFMAKDFEKELITIEESKNKTERWKLAFFLVSLLLIMQVIFFFYFNYYGV